VSEARHIAIDAAEMTVTASFDMQGSILAGTAMHQLHRIKTVLRLESAAPEEEIAALVEQAERMCFVLDAVQRPHEVARTVLLNDVPLA
jgi:organic hydroperoxide reductase OsmC/OhrA